MDDSAADTETTGESVMRYGAVVGALLLVVSYPLPWVNVVGPAADADLSPQGAAQALATAPTDGGTIAGPAIQVVPEFLLGLAVLAVLAALLGWTLLLRAGTGVAGLFGAGLVLYAWAGLGVDDATGYIEVGNLVGPPSSFDPAIGLWIALLGTLLLVVCGFGAAVHGYVERQEGSATRF